MLFIIVIRICDYHNIITILIMRSIVFFTNTMLCRPAIISWLLLPEIHDCACSSVSYHDLYCVVYSSAVPQRISINMFRADSIQGCDARRMPDTPACLAARHCVRAVKEMDRNPLGCARRGSNPLGVVVDASLTRGACKREELQPMPP